MPRYDNTPKDKLPIRIGFETVNNRKRNIYNHSQLLGYAESSSCCWWKGYLPDGTFVTGNHSLEKIGLGLLIAQERS